MWLDTKKKLVRVVRQVPNGGEKSFKVKGQRFVKGNPAFPPQPGVQSTNKRRERAVTGAAAAAASPTRVAVIFHDANAGVKANAEADARSDSAKEGGSGDGRG